jgi:hypothetical protein
LHLGRATLPDRGAKGQKVFGTWRAKSDYSCGMVAILAFSVKENILAIYVNVLYVIVTIEQQRS